MKPKLKTNARKFVYRILKFLIKFYVSFSVAIVTSFLIVSIWFTIFPFSFSEIKSPAYFHRSLIGAVNRAQQSYYFENGSFSENIFVDSKIKEDSTYYNHFFETKDNVAYIYAVPKQQYEKRKIWVIEIGKNQKKPFYSYVGAVTVKEENNKLSLSQVICRNKPIGIIKPNKPILKDNILACTEETRDIKELRRS